MTIIRILLAGVLAIAPAACSKSDTAKTSTETGGADKGSPPSMPPADSAAAINGVMGPYETCRALLAADKTEGVGECAAGIQKAATAGTATAPASAKPHLTATATAAGKLASSAGDLDAARLAFGDVSKAVIALLTSNPEVAAKYHVFECPMAKGFKRWAQADTDHANPYMGTAMSSCGSEVHDHHAGGMMQGGDMPHGN